MLPDNETSSFLGRWADGDFQHTVARNRGVGADADLPDENRFLAGVVQLLRRREAELDRRGESDDADLAIFVLKPTPPDSIIDAVREPMVDNGLARINGRLWFTAAPVISAHYVNLPQDTDHSRFQYITDIYNLGAQPTLVYDPRTIQPQLRWYSEGLDRPNNMELKPLDGVVEPCDVFFAIDHAYRQCLITPGGLPRGVNLWEDAGRYIPAKNAEALLQSHLKAGLVMRFPFCTIRHEQAQPAGRTDLEVEQSDPIDRTRVTRHAILELKVLRSYWASGTTVSPYDTKRHLADGVAQATSYRDEKGVSWSAVCCFDMRRNDVGDDACFAHISETAAERSVWLRRWFLFASAAQLRHSQTTQL